MRKRKNQKILLTGFATIVLFILWTVLVKFVNVQAIGPKKSSVGFATLNGFIHNLTGANMTLYNITDWLGLVPIAFIFGFGLLGLIQLIKRKSLLKVDSNILILGVFYIVVMSAYIFFEFFVINHRPVLIQGILEVSYPSSTTLLVLCVMPTAAMQLNGRVKNIKLRKALVCLIVLFTVFMVVGRLISGVHWVTDIIGGAILSAGLVMLYYGTVNIFAKQ
ncbi:MAG: phosphatase PAP2 family protein [Ruminococcus sp.]|nr:phosphatase PAP2 family protein [Ruminococcus sp.]